MVMNKAYWIAECSLLARGQYQEVFDNWVDNNGDGFASSEEVTAFMVRFNTYTPCSMVNGFFCGDKSPFCVKDLCWLCPWVFILYCVKTKSHSKAFYCCENLHTKEFNAGPVPKEGSKGIPNFWGMTNQESWGRGDSQFTFHRACTSCPPWYLCSPTISVQSVRLLRVPYFSVLLWLVLRKKLFEQIVMGLKLPQTGLSTILCYVNLHL